MLGAGMMGAAIAYVCAKAGIEVVSRTSTRPPPTAARATREKLVAKGVERGKTTQEKGDALLALITATTDAAAAAGADLVIEAVFEDPAVKAQVIAEIEPHLAADALLGSNTSTLPITVAGRERLAPGGLHRPALLLPGGQDAAAGDHQGREDRRRPRCTARSTSPSRSARRRSSSTTRAASSPRRVIGTFINEGIAMLAEGIPAPSIEQASSQAGYPAPVLQLSDELNLKLMRRIRNAAKAAAEAEGGTGTRIPRRRSSTGCSTSSSAPASSRARASTSTPTASARGLWPGLREAFPPVADPSAIVAEGPRGADDVHRGASRRSSASTRA